jgi:flagellar assembly factor FliW
MEVICMKISTTRFGRVDIEHGDVLLFPQGLLGLEDCQQWVLLADAENELLGWLQSTTRPEIAVAVVSPRRFVPSYQVRLSRSELTPLALSQPQHAKVLVIVGRNDRSITLNLKAPLLIHLEQRLGRQVLNNAEHPVQYELQPVQSMKKIA